MSKPDYYEVLEVHREVTVVELKKAYRTKALEHHPDRNPDNPEAEERPERPAEAAGVRSVRACGLGWRWRAGVRRYRRCVQSVPRHLWRSLRRGPRRGLRFRRLWPSATRSERSRARRRHPCRRELVASGGGVRCRA
ncbi:MAG: DnaJ domain-containing protein [Deltaproteobacteria bacterium]|nr:DnaJ domain-containing protein [Deltaproteobacteria bacterium]